MFEQMLSTALHEAAKHELITVSRLRKIGKRVLSGEGSQARQGNTIRRLANEDDVTREKLKKMN